MGGGTGSSVIDEVAVSPFSRLPETWIESSTDATPCRISSRPTTIAASLENVTWAMEMNTYLGEAFGARSVVCAGGPGTALSIRLYNGYDSVADWQERTSAASADTGWQERMQAVTAIADTSTLDTGLIRRLI